jgi:putative two-component system response regulator
VWIAAVLHDVGKLGLPDRLLHKRGAFEEAERERMRGHTLRGRALLFFLPRCVTDVVLSHHERWDGAGYPHALRSTHIPLGARIVAVADVYDALTSRRAYKPAWLPTEAIAHIRGGIGRQFDPGVVAAFLSRQYIPAEPMPVSRYQPAGD